MIRQFHFLVIGDLGQRNLVRITNESVSSYADGPLRPKFLFCLLCGSSPEDLIHFFIACPNLVIPRIMLMARVSALLALLPNFDLLLHDRNSKETFVDTLIFGNSNLSFSDNITILKAAIAFIGESSRFDWDSTTLEEQIVFVFQLLQWLALTLTHQAVVTCNTSTMHGVLNQRWAPCISNQLVCVNL